MISSASHPDLEWSPTSDIGCASRQVAELWGWGWGACMPEPSHGAAGELTPASMRVAGSAPARKPGSTASTWGQRRNRINSLGPGLAARASFPRSDKNLSRLGPRLGRLA